jgi:hypothetical protein
MKHGSTHTLKAIEKFALVVLRITEIQDNESDQNRQENSHIISLHKGESISRRQRVSCIEARQPDFEQRPLDDVFLYQGFRRLLNKCCVIARRELTLDVQHEDAECQRLRLITSRP